MRQGLERDRDLWGPKTAHEVPWSLGSWESLAGLAHVQYSTTGMGVYAFVP